MVRMTGLSLFTIQRIETGDKAFNIDTLHIYKKALR